MTSGPTFVVLPGSNCHLRYLYKEIEAPNIIIALIACDSIDVFTSTFNLIVIHGISIGEDGCQNVRRHTEIACQIMICIGKTEEQHGYQLMHTWLLMRNNGEETC